MKEEATVIASPDEIISAPLADIDPFVHQSREEFDDATLRDLAESIKQHGQLQPGLAWLDAGRNRLVLICGERRYRAIKIAGLPTMLLKVVRGNLTPGQMLALNLAENIQRASLGVIERAKAFRRLMQLENLTASGVAVRMAVSNATVSRDLSLLDLPESLQARIASGVLPSTVAAYIARIDDDATRRSLADDFSDGILDRAGLAARVNAVLKPKEGGSRRLSVKQKQSGLSLSVTGNADKWTYDNLMAVLNRIGKEAKSLREAGRFDHAALAAVLKAS
jgi:ParB family chromosome partitioning protein